MSISLSKWPMLPTIAWCFIWRHVLGHDDVLVAGGGDEDVGLADDVLERDDLEPSIAACSAQIGSISVTTTRAPWPRSDSAQPLPTSP